MENPMQFNIFENRLTNAQFQELRIKSGMDMLDSRMVSKALENSIIKLSVEDNGEIVGMLRVVGDGSFTFVIVDVLVDPNYRRRGIGSSLVNYANDMIKRELPAGKWTTVSLFSVKGKEGFYKKLGFQKAPYGEVGHGMQTFVKGWGYL
jgi:ribosomal protein S18 acetylase RimI-like enzyme